MLTCSFTKQTAMKNKGYWALTIVVLGLSIYACKSPEKKDNSLSEKLDAYLKAEATYHRFNGNVLIAENGKILFQKSYGFSNFDSQQTLNDSTVFELASVSKQFTATAILMLKDEGKLSLSDTLRKFFPELPYEGITIYQMLTHTSGLPDYEEAMSSKWDHKKIAFNNDIISFFAKEKPAALFKPGTKWLYSNTAYAILASIVEKESGEPFPTFLSKRIFTPLSMSRTRIYNTRRSLKDTIPNYAYGFLYNDSTKKYQMPDSMPGMDFVYYLDGIFGDGVVNSTTADLLKWDRSVKTHRLLSETSQAEMLKGQALMDTANKWYYGFGVGIQKTDSGDIIAHSGGWPGYVTYLARNVAKDQTYIVLSNNASNSPAISNALMDIVNGKEIVIAYEHKAIELDSNALKVFVGKYQGKQRFQIEQKAGKLFFVSANGDTQELKPESNTRFFFAKQTYMLLDFELDKQKKITKVMLINHGKRSDVKLSDE